MLVTSLRAGAGQGLAPVIDQKQGRGGADFFAGLIANVLPPVFGGRVAAVELDVGTVVVGPFSRNKRSHTPCHDPSLRQALKRAYTTCQVRDAPVKNYLTGNKRH